MLNFSHDPDVAENQMHAIIFYLTAFGYIDGEFDRSEKTFVKIFIRQLVQARAKAAMPDADEAVRADVVNKFVSHFHEVFEQTDHMIQDWFTEVVADDENVEEFVRAKLKLRSFEIFKSFDEENQKALLDTVEELINADGQVHPAEARFRDEIQALLEIPLDIRDVEMEPTAADIEIDAPADKQSSGDNHPFFQFEYHYSSDPVRLRKQADDDYQLIMRTMAKFDEQRETGAGKLTGAHDVSVFDGQEPFLDGHVYIHPIEPDAHYELTVLGDLHGCYSCLKGSLMQADFFAKIEAYKLDPRHNPKPILVLLGDYIDRGRFSYNGVLRTVMQLFLSAPDHVYVLRGNHEYYVEFKGRIYGGVKPAEAINSLVKHMPKEMFEAYMKLFEAMPNMLLFDRTFFVHAGIPRDALIRERWTDMSSLNDPDIRFQMLWSDPSEADHIPDELQAQNARFPFGRYQFERFMAMVGCNTFVRGHEKVLDGFRSVYPLGQVPLLNLFSAGGSDNDDLPANSSYRDVTPMAMTMTIKNGVTKVSPWPIDYKRFNDPTKNKFFASVPEIEHGAS
ncbi:MAG TPA: metallophosphoesterase family protein [Kofleriaceae bacterium]|nr:metallophosphoesterase family protein [Kofleriaceae bacterium]